MTEKYRLSGNKQSQEGVVLSKQAVRKIVLLIFGLLLAVAFLLGWLVNSCSSKEGVAGKNQEETLSETNEQSQEIKNFSYSPEKKLTEEPIKNVVPKSEDTQIRHKEVSVANAGNGKICQNGITIKFKISRKKPNTGRPWDGEEAFGINLFGGYTAPDPKGSVVLKINGNNEISEPLVLRQNVYAFKANFFKGRTINLASEDIKIQITLIDQDEKNDDIIANYTWDPSRGLEFRSGNGAITATISCRLE